MAPIPVTIQDITQTTNMAPIRVTIRDITIINRKRITEQIQEFMVEATQTIRITQISMEGTINLFYILITWEILFKLITVLQIFFKLIIYPCRTSHGQTSIFTGKKKSNKLFGGKIGKKGKFALAAGAGFAGGAAAGIAGMEVYHRYKQYKAMLHYKVFSNNEDRFHSLQ